ncbi:hypothetical protein BDY24DRAFT_444494 [Mrakia frigida]|uniref:uncharacterized protein n=1 Tax=Mrakia frigida TaxID=29902 RepID=UPI003FCC0F0C
MSSSNRSPQVPKPTLYVCEAYIRGRCFVGDDCRDLHISDIPAYHQLRQSQLDEGMRNPQTKSCRWGSNCWIARCSFCHQEDVRGLARSRAEQPETPTSETEPQHQVAVATSDDEDGAGTESVVSVVDEHKPDEHLVAIRTFSKNPVVPEVEGSLPFNSASEVVGLVAYVLTEKASVEAVQNFASLKPDIYKTALEDGHEGFPLIFFAVAANNKDLVEHLLSSSSTSPDVVGGPSIPLLAFALVHQHYSEKTEMVKLILSHGAKVSVIPQGLFSPPLSPSGSSSISARNLPLWYRTCSRTWDALLSQSLLLDTRHALEIASKMEPARPRDSQVLGLVGLEGLARLPYEQRLLGQEMAVRRFLDAVVVRLISSEPVKPLVFFLAGPEGHGQFEFVDAIAKSCNLPMNQFDMGEEHIGIFLTDFLASHEGKIAVVALRGTGKDGELDRFASAWERGLYKMVSGSSRLEIDCKKIIWLVLTPIANNYVLGFFEEGQHRAALSRGSIGTSIEEELVQGIKSLLRGALKNRITQQITAILPFLPYNSLAQQVVVSRCLLNLRRHVSASVSVSDPASLHPCGDMELEFSASTELAVAKDVADRFYLPSVGERSLTEGVKTVIELPLLLSWRKRDGGKLKRTHVYRIVPGKEDEHARVVYVGAKEIILE